MTKPAVMQGSYVDLRFMPGLKVARVSIDIPIEHSNEFLRMFGAPDRASPVWCAVARLATPAEPSGAQAPERSEPKREYTRSQLAAIKCQDPVFASWIIRLDAPPYNAPARTADTALKSWLGIGSKRELDSNPEKAANFDKLLASFDYRDRV